MISDVHGESSLFCQFAPDCLFWRRMHWRLGVVQYPSDGSSLLFFGFQDLPDCHLGVVMVPTEVMEAVASRLKRFLNRIE